MFDNLVYLNKALSWANNTTLYEFALNRTKPKEEKYSDTKNFNGNKKKPLKISYKNVPLPLKKCKLIIKKIPINLYRHFYKTAFCILHFFCLSFRLPPLKFLFPKVNGLLRKIRWQYFVGKIYHFVLFFSASINIK